MKKSLAVCLIGLLAASYWGYSQAQPGPATRIPPEQKEIYKALEDMAAAFNKQDAKAISALYTEAGVYTSVNSGERLQGRAAIEADTASFFAKEKNARLTIDVDSVRMITADVAGPFEQDEVSLKQVAAAVFEQLVDLIGSQPVALEQFSGQGARVGKARGEIAGQLVQPCRFEKFMPPNQADQTDTFHGHAGLGKKRK